MRHSKRSLEGEILIDHRAGPGLTPEQVGSFAAPAVSKGQAYESAVIVCSHCQYAVVRNPKRTREIEWCSKCDKYICDDCSIVMNKTLECKSFERRMDTIHNELERGVSPLLLGHLLTD